VLSSLESTAEGKRRAEERLHTGWSRSKVSNNRRSAKILAREYMLGGGGRCVKLSSRKKLWEIQDECEG